MGDSPPSKLSEVLDELEARLDLFRAIIDEGNNPAIDIVIDSFMKDKYPPPGTDEFTRETYVRLAVVEMCGKGVLPESYKLYRHGRKDDAISNQQDSQVAAFWGLDDRVMEALGSWNEEEGPSLKVFEMKQEAVFYAYWKENGIPSLPTDENCPSLLLHDLENDSHKLKDAYRYIDRSQKAAPIGLYGTSRAGKTRTSFEYLAHNYGLYFVADKTMNPGSFDVMFLLQKCSEDLVHLSGSPDTKKKTSEANLKVVRGYLNTLVSVRKAVFKYVDQKLKSNRGGKGLSCHEWLLLQLYPHEFLGCDVFRDLCGTFFGHDVGDVEVGMKMSCFVDEAQILLTKLDGYFLSKDGNQERSAYSAFVKGLHYLAVAGKVHFPCFSGTGLSVDAFRSETISVAVAKPANHSFAFTELKMMTTGDVQEYMKKFLNLDGVGRELVVHVAKWLRGRPRWTATFLETFLVRKEKREQPRGKFAETELPFIKALCRYIEVVTESEETSRNRRHSWSLSERSAYACIGRLFRKRRQKDEVALFEAQSEFRRAIFDYSLSGDASVVLKQAVTLIECGVASVAAGSHTLAAGHIRGKIDEPLMVQAGINFFGIEKSVTQRLVSARSESEKGFCFEEFVIPSIQANFSAVMASQLQEQLLVDLKDYAIPKWSSYGVLVRNCKTSRDTIEWIQRAMATRFEGSVEPFCYPDESFGPDLVFLMWEPKYDGFQFVASQAKYKKRLNQAEALRTLVPELFFRENGELGVNAPVTLTGGDLEAWSKVEKELFQIKTEEDPGVGSCIKQSKKVKAPTKKRKRDMIRFVVQYPAERSASATPGPVAFAEHKSVCKPPCKCPKHDLLVTIDNSNANALFGEKGVEILGMVKDNAT